MNSFYGQVRWGEQYQRFFYEFRLTNREYDISNLFNTNPPEGTNSTLQSHERMWIRPYEDFAKFDINAANHWLKLVPLDAAGDGANEGTNLGFSLFHNAPDKDHADLVTIFTIVDQSSIPSGSNVQTIKSGELFKINNPYFDYAGHFTGVDDLNSTYFKFPEQIIKVNNSDNLNLKEDGKFHFFQGSNGLITLKVNSSNDELTFAHKTYFKSDELSDKEYCFKFEGERTGTMYTTERALAPGDFISTSELSFDTAGHLTKIEKIYYQLPYSDNDKRLELLENAVTEINSEIGTLKDRVKKNEDAISELNKLKNQLGHESQFEDLAKVMGLLTGTEDITEDSSVATTIKTVAEYINSSIKGQITGIYSRLSILDEFIYSKHKDYVIPST